MRRYDYKTKRDAYKNTDWCRAKRSEGKISMTPHKRDKPEYFTGLPAEKTVIIPETRDAAAAGAALRLPWIVAIAAFSGVTRDHRTSTVVVAYAR